MVLIESKQIIIFLNIHQHLDRSNSFVCMRHEEYKKSKLTKFVKYVYSYGVC